MSDSRLVYFQTRMAFVVACPLDYYSPLVLFGGILFEEIASHAKSLTFPTRLNSRKSGTHLMDFIINCQHFSG